MHHHALSHALAVAIFVLYFLYLLSGVLRTLLEDISPYAISEEELTALDTHSNLNQTEFIPKIIHQVYLGWDNKVMPVHWKGAQQSCIDLHPDYEYVLWTNQSARDLLSTQYPWFLETYDNYPYPIQRADSIRYFILAHYGGIYIDLDNGCNRDLGPLLTFPAWMPGTKIQVGLTNHVMGSKREHPYFNLLVNSLQKYNYNWVLPYMTIMNSAGPHFVSMVWEEYLNTDPRQEEVRILKQEEYAGNERSFFTKEQGGTWNQWDTRVFKWIGDRLLLFCAACFLCLCIAASCIWRIWWKVIVCARKGAREGSQNSSLPLWQKSE